MLRSAKEIHIHAEDGEVGSVETLYFDEESWRIRHFVVGAGNLLTNRDVLLSPEVVREKDETASVFVLRSSLTREEIKSAPAAVQQRKAHPVASPSGPGISKERSETGDPHLRSTREVRGYRVRSRDGEIGHVEDFVVDTECWTIRYVAVDTRDWLPGKKVLVASPWVLGVSWADAEASVDLDSIEVKEAPAWNPDAPVDRTCEEKLYAYYGRTPYWVYGE